jgi:hypothetical protein
MKVPEANRGPQTFAEVFCRAGQHHLRLNMYIAQARNGKFEIVKNLGVISPKETSRSALLELSAVG